MLGLKFHTFAFALLVTMKSVQKSTEKLPTPCCDDVISVLTSRYKTKCREKVFPSRSLFLWTTKALPSPLYTILTLRVVL